VTLLEAGIWAFDRYVTKQDYAFISLETIKKNFHSGFQFDPDHFAINQFGHPFQGGLFFAAARSNGFGFWTSSAFALSGSLIWECCMENSPPSINDLVRTRLSAA
jgi:hypothetical protein